MKARVELWVKLKVMDLVNETAFDTLTEKLDFAESLLSLFHYWYWSMSAEGNSIEEILDEIERAIRIDSAFTNQNKHKYRLKVIDGGARGDLTEQENFPRIAKHQGVFIVDALVRQKSADIDASFAERINARLRGVSVSEMKYGEVWRMVIAAPNSSEALLAADRMLVSRARREGLLINPHYQQYEILATWEL